MTNSSKSSGSGVQAPPGNKGDKNTTQPGLPEPNSGPGTSPHLSAQLGHSGGIASVALSGDGKWLVTGSADRTALLWEITSGREVRSFQGHTDSVIAVALSSDGRRLVTGSADGTARLWDVASGKEIRSFKGHTDVVSSVTLSSDGKWLVTGRR